MKTKRERILDKLIHKFEESDNQSEIEIEIKRTKDIWTITRLNRNSILLDDDFRVTLNRRKVLFRNCEFGTIVNELMDK